MMHSSVQLLHQFLLWLCTLLLLLGLVGETKSYPMPFHYPRTDWSRHGMTSAKSNVREEDEESQEIIHYKLDAWSQYDNPEEGTNREGDILEHPLSRKTSTMHQQLLWPRGIVYYYLSPVIINARDKYAILQNAISTIMQETCIRFIQIRPDLYGRFPSIPWVNITANGGGCFSDLGRSPTGISQLNLEMSRCFLTPGHALHELLHTLGVYHEHMRPDRDQYIKIMWHNIRRGEEYNFQMLNRYTVTSFGMPYDFDSIMHYSMTAFSKAWNMPSIIPLKQNVVIGQRSHLSAIDINKLRFAYNCSQANYYQYHRVNKDQLRKQLTDTNKTHAVEVDDRNHRKMYEAEAPENDRNSDVVYVNLLNLLVAIGYLFHPRPLSFLKPNWNPHLHYPVYPECLSY